MTLKERKQLIEQNIRYGLSRSVGENVIVGVAYDINSGLISASLTEQHLDVESNVLEGVVNYGIRYDENTDQLSIYAFSRRYQYDALGIIATITDPVYVDEGFIATVKELIKFGASDNFDVSVFDPQPVEEAVEAELIEAEPIEAEIVEE